MNTTKKSVTFLILVFTHLDILKSECFNFDTKFVNVSRDNSINLDCIRVILSKSEDLSFLLNMEIPKVISTGLVTSKRKHHTSFCPNLIAQLHSVENLEAIFDFYASQRGFIFILFSQKPDWNKILQHSTYYWNKYKVYKAFYITSQHCKFYHPFVKRHSKYGAMVDTRNYNMADIFKNLHGYPIRMYIFDSVFSKVKAEQIMFNFTKVEGADAKVAFLLEKQFNFTMQLQWPYENFFGARLENGSFDGALGRIIRNEADVVMTGFFVKDYLTRDIHFSVSVYMDKLCCYVMKSKRIPESILPLYAVDKNIWFVYMAVGFSSSVVWVVLRATNLYICKHMGKPETLNKSIFSPILCVEYSRVIADSWVLWMRMIAIRYPPYTSERIFAISLCLVSVITEALFMSSLATIYTRPTYFKDINTLEELEMANLKMFIKHAAIRDDLFRGQSSSLYNSLNERVELVGEPEDRLINIMSRRGGFAAVTREFSLLIDDIYYFITNKIHIIPECPKTYHIAYLYTKDSPYEETFNVALLQFLAAGLIDQWIAASRHQAQRQIRKFKNFNYPRKGFKIKDLQLAFYVLIFGNVCAILIFIAENIKAKKSIQQK